MSPTQTLTPGVTHITATQRLARELHAEYARVQQADGAQAWESADVVTWDGWLKGLWQEYALTQPDCPTLLDPLQAVAVWEDIISADIATQAAASRPLWNVHASAKTAVAAWRMLQDWQIALADCAQSFHQDHQCFVRWAKRFVARCQEKNWIDTANLAAQLQTLCAARKLTALPPRIALLGFDQFTPRQSALLDALAGSGVEIEKSAAEKSVAAEAQRWQYRDPQTQWLAAATWAREKLRHNPDARLAIIAPDLSSSAAPIEYALMQIVAPSQLITPGVRADRPWHTALGQRLNQYPVVQAALTLLSPMGGKPLPNATLRELVLSPYLGGAQAEAAARARLARCCSRWPWQLGFERFVGRLERAQATQPELRCPQFANACKSQLPQLQDLRKKQNAAHWVQQFSKCLDRWGWNRNPDAPLDSDEYQAAQALREELRNLALLDFRATKITAADALRWLRQRTAERIFQVADHSPPLQVLSVTEAAGQRFDGIWFGDLVENHWPPPPRPHPFVRRDLQTQAGVPEALLEGSRELAAIQQARLMASAAEVILSVPETVDGVQVLPSTLVGDFKPPPATDRASPTPARLLNEQKPSLEMVVDLDAKQASAEKPPSGGATLIADQAQCPFRAFAVHRLKARSVAPDEQGLNDAERGELLHRALQGLWQVIQSVENLRNLNPEQREAQVKNSVAQAVQKMRGRSGCGENFAAALTDWAEEMLSQWLEVDAAREDDFSVRGLEVEMELELAKLPLRFRIDRIDENAQGVVVLDYKTGRPESLKNWRGMRPRSPQLPLYVLAQREKVAAVAYAQVRRGEFNYVGVARDPALSDKAKPVAESPLGEEFGDWDELQQHWQSTLTHLAQQFLDGKAQVAPLDARVCEYCDLHGLCRIGSESQ